MADVTKFLMTDETGQSIAAAINAINPNDAVRYSAQTLTDAQKAQARSNIGAISDVSTKADKVDGATNGNLAGLDSNGNLTDSTIPASDVTQLKNDLSELTDSVGGLGNAIGMHGWNQILNSKTLESDSQTISGVHFTVNSNGSITVSGTATANVITYFHNRRHEPFINSHKYLLSISSQHKNVFFIDAYDNLWNTGTAQIVTYNNQSCICALLIYESESVDATIYPMEIDLTELFGAGNEPTSVEQFRQMFPAEYYPYCMNEATSEVLNITTVITQAELDSALSDDNIGQGVYYRKAINVNAGGLSLEGASWFIEGCKVDADYAWQTAKTYAASGIASKSRSKLGGVWNAWV